MSEASFTALKSKFISLSEAGTELYLEGEYKLDGTNVSTANMDKMSLLKASDYLKPLLDQGDLLRKLQLRRLLRATGKYLDSAKG